MRKLFFQFNVNNIKNEKEDIEKTKKASSTDKKPLIILPSLELSAEREEEMINYIVTKIRDKKMESPAILFLSQIKPVSSVGSQLVLLPIAPFLDLIGINIYDYIGFFMNRKNVEKL